MLRISCPYGDSNNPYIQHLRQKYFRARTIKSNGESLFVKLALNEPEMTKIHDNIKPFQFNYHVKLLKKVTDECLFFFPPEIRAIINEYFGNCAKMVFLSQQKTVYESDWIIYRSTIRPLANDLLRKWKMLGNHQLNFYDNMKMVSLRNELTQQIGSTIVFLNKETRGEIAIEFHLSLGIEAHLIDPRWTRDYPCHTHCQIEHPALLSSLVPWLVLTINVKCLKAPCLISDDLPFAAEQTTWNGMIRVILGELYASTQYSSFICRHLVQSGATTGINILFRDEMGRKIRGDDYVEGFDDIIVGKFHITHFPVMEAFETDENTVEVERLCPNPSRDQQRLIQHMEYGRLRRFYDPEDQSLNIGRIYHYKDTAKDATGEPFKRYQRYGVALLFSIPMYCPVITLDSYRYIMEARYQLYRAKTRYHFNNITFRNINYVRSLMNDREKSLMVKNETVILADDYCYDGYQSDEENGEVVNDTWFPNEEHNRESTENTNLEEKMVCTNFI